jgi:hypothetical protein
MPVDFIVRRGDNEGLPPLADVAELADAHDSGSCARNGVEVQVLSSAPKVLFFNNLAGSIESPVALRVARSFRRNTTTAAFASIPATSSAAPKWPAKPVYDPFADALIIFSNGRRRFPRPEQAGAPPASTGLTPTSI